MALTDVIRGFMEGSQPAPQRIEVVNTGTLPGAQGATTPGANSNVAVPGATTPVSDGSLLAIPKAGEGTESPLANFEKLFTVEKSDAAPASLMPTFKLDPKAIMEGARKIDYGQSISPEAKAAAAKGDFSMMINEVGQTAFANAAMMSGTMVQNALSQMTQKFETEVLPERLRQHDVRSQLVKDNPIFDNPAVKPMINMAETALRAKNPTASAEEITKLAKQYVSEMSSAVLTGAGKIVTDAPPVVAGAKSTEEIDWLKLMGAE